MNDRACLAELVRAIVPLDELEAEHQAATLKWIESDAPLYRVEKPAVPPKHLVSYIALVDANDGAMLLVDHRDARLWLPTGGHVEPGEDPSETVQRELLEELGIESRLLAGLSSNPLLVTETTTVGATAGHVDVSLWYAVAGSCAMTLTPDPGEFAGTRWWTFDEIARTNGDGLDPHLPRFVSKLRRDLAHAPVTGRP